MSFFDVYPEFQVAQMMIDNYSLPFEPQVKNKLEIKISIIALALPDIV